MATGKLGKFDVYMETNNEKWKWRRWKQQLGVGLWMCSGGYGDAISLDSVATAAKHEQDG